MRDPVSALPSELSILIFRQLTLQEITQCMFVCNKWYRFLDGYAALWCTVDIRHGMYKSQSPDDDDICIRSPTLSSTNSASSRRRQSDLLISSDIDGNKDVTRTLADADIATIARRAGPALSKLSLDFVPHLSDAAVCALILYNCTNIRHLDLRANQTISTNVLEALVENVKDRLEFLSLRSTEIDDSFVQSLLKKAAHLVHLDISFCRKITKSAFPLVDQNSNLVFTPPADVFDLIQIIAAQVDISTNRLIFSADSDLDLSQLMPVNNTRLPKLETLIAAGCACVGIAAVTRIVRVFGQTLDMLDVSQSPVTIDVLQQISTCIAQDHTSFKRPLKLHTLKLCNMDHSLSADIMQRAMVPESITGPEHAWSFADFALVVPNLVSISLGGENNCITDDLVVQIATNCKHLVSIDVHGSIRLSHPSLAALGENCARLEYVDISECLGCEDRGVVALVSRCGALKSLNLSGLHIGDDSLSVIGDCLRGLERLVLDSCWRITSQGIRSMVARFSESGCTRKLRRLSFIDCISVGVDDVAWCRERLHPSAKITGSSVVPFV